MPKEIAATRGTDIIHLKVMKEKIGTSKSLNNTSTKNGVKITYTKRPKHSIPAYLNSDDEKKDFNDKSFFSTPVQLNFLLDKTSIVHAATFEKQKLFL